MAKVVIIGGGSYKWSPGLVRDMAVNPALKGTELWLVDINEKALSDLYNCAKAIIDRVDCNFKLYSTTDRRQALKDADFVIITISTGGLEAMRYDLEIPYKYGIYQTVGDTVGPGGLARALRSVPVFLEFADDFRRLCPRAWILNLTNPMTVLTQLLVEEGCRVIGLCHELYAIWGLIKDHFSCNWSDIELSVAGVNHFAFILSARYKGYDCFDLFRQWAEEVGDQMLSADVELTHKETHSSRHLFKLDYFRKTGRMLYPGDRHTSEFFHNVLTEETKYGEIYGIQITRIEDRYKWLEDAKEKVYSWISDPLSIDLRPSREPIAGIIASMITGETMIDVVNLPNTGQIENMPRGVVVETMGRFSTDSVEPLPVGNLPVDIASMLNYHSLRFNLVIEAARKGSRKLALEALILDPLVREYKDAERLLDELLMAHREYLPQFREFVS